MLPSAVSRKFCPLLIAITLLSHRVHAQSGKYGEVAFANSGAASAQPAFLRGLALLHNFQYTEATDAFREAQRLDPSFAMAYWGEAMTYNHGVWREQDSVAARAVIARVRVGDAARRRPREE